MGRFAPALTGMAAAQGAVPASLAGLRGKVVVIDFWAGWCSVCKLVTPVLNGWHQKLGAQGLVVLGVSSDTATVASKAIDDFGIKYAVGLDKDGAIFPAYGISSLPTMFIVDKRGVVRGIEIGFDPAGLVRAEALVNALLAEKAPED
jgi:peroxiredoxin